MIPINFPPDSGKGNLKPDSTLTQKDSLSILNDSTKLAADTIKTDSLAIDSTARMKFFDHTHEEAPYVKLQMGKTSPFIAEPSANIRTRTAEIDSTGKYVVIKEKIAGQESKILLRVPIDEYIKAKMQEQNQQNWEDLGYNYKLNTNEKGLSEVISSITNIDIPLPKVGVLSIFGTPKISLKIGGAVDIHGAWKNSTTEGITASGLGNTRNEPDFKQQVQINVNGTIGDKLNISADWNTERTFQYENQLKIKYTGYEDEIIQSIEAGNVSLQTSPLVGGSEALFGVKAKFQMGPLTLTTLASQKKGEVKTVDVSGGSTSQDFQIRAYNYSTNHFFVDTIYASTLPQYNFFERYYSNATPDYDPNYQIVDIQVWKSVNQITSDRSQFRKANAYINLGAKPENGYADSLRQNLTNPVPGQKETGNFVLLQAGVDYILHPYTGFITFISPVNDENIIAVAYRVKDTYYGDFVTPTSKDTTHLVLKLVKPQYLKPEYTEAWKLQLKNIYPVGGRNIKKDGFEFHIKYEVEGQDPVEELPTGGKTVRLLNAFGLDELDASGNPVSNGDGVFDYRPDFTIMPQTGEIIFPTLQPFGKNFPSSLSSLDSLKYSDIYNKSVTIASQNRLEDKWELTGKYSGEASSTYQLGFNIVENSVKVLLNGAELSAGSDYTVDYNTGQLTIRNDAALVPGANLKISYEQNDLFQLASKTLVGARGILNISQKTKLGFSFLNLNQQTLSDKVRIGEEPLSNSIYGVDFNTQMDLPFLTKGLDKIFSTKEMSSLTLAAEYAYMNPNPNTKVSTIASDNGQSIAYIDDFEGSKQTIPIGVSYTSWKDLSPPSFLPGLDTLAVTPLAKMDYKGKSWWYTITPSNVFVKDIWGNRKKVATTDQQVTVLDYVFKPDTPGTYNYNPKLQNPTQAWGGAMTILSSTANNLVDQNINAIEFWLHIDSAPANAKVYVDLGRISEDVIPNDSLNTEDKNLNDAIDPGEDVGLDGMTNAEEQAYCRLHGYSAANKADPSGDDFSFSATGSSNPFDYFHINGTEGNAQLTDAGRLPDTEDLNRSGTLDNVNSYFRYAIPLDTNKATNKFIAGGGDGDVPGWYLFRIPLKDAIDSIGNPSLTNVETIRLLVTDAQSMVHLRFAEFDLVGNQWQKIVDTAKGITPEDTALSISVVSIEDNPDYTSPPGVAQARDRSHPDQQVYLNEQALNLIISSLPQNESREAVKYLYRPLDVFNYKEMKLFIHGGENPVPHSVSNNDGTDFNADVYFEFGSDSNNYYEYREPITPGWNEISILFSDLTAIKQARNPDSTNTLKRLEVPGKPGQYYGVKGNPSLTSVKYLLVGIYNRNDQFDPGPISGEVWVNELRVVGADNTPGWAYTFNSTLKLADLMTVNFNMSRTNPYFHQLSDRFGSRVDQKNWAFSTNLDVLKLLPFNMPESSLLLNYSHTETIGDPLFMPGTDIRVDQAAKQLESSLKNDSNYVSLYDNGDQLKTSTQQVSISNSISASNVKLKIPTSFWWVRDSWNSLSYGFNYNKTFARSPNILSNKSWVWNATVNYGVNFNPNYYFEPARIPVIGFLFGIFSDYKNAKVYYSPQSFTMNVSERRNRSISITRPQLTASGITSSQLITSHDFTASRGFNLNWKMTENGFLNLTTNFSANVNSTLAYLEADSSNNFYPESRVWRDIFTGSIFGRANQYTQTLDLSTQPRLPSLWDIDKFFTISAGYTASYQWNNDFRQVQLGRSAGFSSKSNIGLTLRLKALSAPFFKEETPQPQEQQQQQGNNFRRGRGRDFGNEANPEEKRQGEISDTTKNENVENLAVSDTSKVETKNKKSSLIRFLGFLKTGVRVLLFDYESITFNFTNQNSLSKSGILGTGTGFKNFVGFMYDYKDGPSRGFMLGLSGDVGKRAPSANLTDAFSQSNTFDFKTSRPLWQGAKIDLTWNVAWSVQKTTSFQTDSLGNVFTTSPPVETGTITRSFLSFPPVLFLSSFKSGIKRVSELYNPNSSDPNQSLSNAFINGFESLPIFSRLGFLKEFAKYIPRPNWRISWTGLEKLSFFKSFTQSVSLDHSYGSTYAEGWKITPDGVRQIQTQKVQYGFTPLIGLNITFNQLWGGNITGSIKYSTNTSYDLGISTSNITENATKDIGVTASYSKSGFAIPLFGISLKNDIEFSLSYTNSQNSSVRYDMTQFTESGIPQDGTNSITIEPSIKYTISQKVTLSIYYKRSSIQPEGASRIPPTTSNEAGLDVHISIQ